ncbi:T9SS type A sorting domain-containing protein [Kaistella flava (ex Peng et al. 2021)]|uniref:phospholipase D n=1 Tax=Kaistella flava (ex Peng et al. 2021) TaxID=2038776 RepID=A0A7M2Y8X8_9FLAO|nr:phospholipase D-like domain-containing protein [Kaistella flava (ex Peng et al. 2021)]QOW10289.1 T9SS type A sorting domain-containing protein [Kaistella flava (ex Peng et al. 2021)]
MKKYLLFAILFFQSILLYSQISSKERDFVITYNSQNIDIKFAYPVNVKAYSGKYYNNEVTIERNTTDKYIYTLQNTPPSTIIKLEYEILEGENTGFQTSFIAAPSKSSGTIDVFFNHPVDITYSQGQNAVNLGNMLDDKLISYINACTTSLDIAIYNSYSPSSTTGIAGAINNAFARGVQVRIVYDGSTGSAMIPLLNSSIPRIASPNNSNYGIMHNKFVIFDANVSDANKPIVWTGSTNWTVAQIDGPDKNSAIVIQDQSLALGYQIEFEEMWGSSTATPIPFNSRFGPYKMDNTPHTYNIGGKIVNSYFSPSDGTNGKIIETINSADTDINVATMLITRTDISAALIDKYTNGLYSIQLIMDTQNPQGNQKALLQTEIGAARVRTDTSKGVMHHKFMVVDNYNSSSDPLVLVGSHNWSSAAENKNDENTLIVHDLNIANQYYQAFAYLYKLSGGVISNPLAVENNQKILNNYLIYPNPSKGIFNIKNENVVVGNTDIRIYDASGKRIDHQTISNFNTKSFDLTNQPTGIYFVVITNELGVSHIKIIKQ